MDTRLVATAIPFFFLLIGLEMALSRLQKVRRYRFHDSIASLSCGIGEQVIVVFTGALAILGYAFVSRHVALFPISASSPLAWVLLFFLVDHSYYWFHRSSHRVNFLWAGHAVHHQSEEYNLSTALRQNWFENLLAWPFYLPLALVGFPLPMFLTVSTVNTLYQFWVHTRAIRRLGPVEGVLNTPSSHRVHHGIDPQYVDKNYGGMFMLWDRVYGTYEPEGEEPHYGTVKPLESWNPLWANVHGWARMWTMARGTTAWNEKLAVWFAPPEWQPAVMGGRVTVPVVDVATYKKYDTEASRALDRYVYVQFGLVSAATSAIMWFAPGLPKLFVAGASSWVVLALVSWGGLFEARRWALPVELCRHLGGIALAAFAFYAGEPIGLVYVAALSAAISVPLLLAARPRRSADTDPRTHRALI